MLEAKETSAGSSTKLSWKLTKPQLEAEQTSAVSLTNLSWKLNKSQLEAKRTSAKANLKGNEMNSNQTMKRLGYILGLLNFEREGLF